MMGPLYLFLSLASLSQARSIAPSVADSNQVPVADARFDDGAVNFGSGMPLPGFRNKGPQYGQQPAYGGQQPAYGGQPGYGQQAPTYESSPEYAGQPGYSSPGYGPGAPLVPGYGPSQGSGQQQQHYPDQGQHLQGQHLQDQHLQDQHLQDQRLQDSTPGSW